MEPGVCGGVVGHGQITSLGAGPFSDPITGEPPLTPGRPAIAANGPRTAASDAGQSDER
jgi:hypothetical protein